MRGLQVGAGERPSQTAGQVHAEKGAPGSAGVGRWEPSARPPVRGRPVSAPCSALRCLQGGRLDHTAGRPVPGHAGPTHLADSAAGGPSRNAGVSLCGPLCTPPNSRRGVCAAALSQSLVFRRIAALSSLR